MRILVIGGAGYVGSVIVTELLGLGYSVRVYDRLYFGQGGLDSNIDRVDLRIGDIRSINADVFDGIDAVINLGGLSNDPTAEFKPKANKEMNTDATLTSALGAINAGISRYVYASSCSVYYSKSTDERRDLLLTEDATINPRAAYSKSKYDGERKLLKLAAEHKNFCPVILRKGTIFGYSPRMRFDLVVNSFVKDAIKNGVLRVHNGGEMWRPLLEINDAARAYIDAIQADDKNVRGQIFNIATKNYRISELALRVKEVLLMSGIRCDISPEYRPQPLRSYRVDTTKARNLLGFVPKVSLEEGVKHIIDEIKLKGDIDFSDPMYYNIKWLQLLEKAEQIIKPFGGVF